MLRTTIPAPSAQPYQHIDAELDLPLPTTDLTTLPTADAESTARNLVYECSQEPFSLAVAR